MASLPNSKTITYEEWLRMPEVKGEEVVNGEIRKMPAPNWMHTEVVHALYDEIRPQIDKRDVAVINSPFDLIVRRNLPTSRQPDLAAFQRSSIVKEEGRVVSAPQLIIEVLSPSNTRRELTERLADYAAVGAPEVWIFSYEALTAEVLYLAEGRYVRQFVQAEGVLRPTHFPTVGVDISKVWPE